MAHGSNGISREVAHYVVTSHPPGGVLCSVKCNFLAPDSQDVIVAKSRRLEVRQFKTMDEEEAAAFGGGATGPAPVDPMVDYDGDQEQFMSPFPVVLTVPVNGRITALEAFYIPNHPLAFLFVLTDNDQYAVISYDVNSSSNDPNNPYPIRTHVSDSLQGEAWNMMGRASECGPLVAVDPHNRCIVLHVFDGLITVLPIIQHFTPPQSSAAAAMKSDGAGGYRAGMSESSSSPPPSILGFPFHARIEERTVLNLTMLHHLDAITTPPHICILHQDSRGAQHVTTHCVDLHKSQIWFLTGLSGSASSAPPTCEWLKKSRIDGGSSMLIPVPPRSTPVAAVASAPAAGMAPDNSANTPGPSGGIVILGQRQITYCGYHHYKVMPIPPALLLTWDFLPPDVSGMPRFLLGDEFGNLHMLTLLTSEQQPQTVIALQLDTLGSCTLSSQLTYLEQGLVFVGSTLGDSQLIQIHDEPIPLVEDIREDGTAISDDDFELGDTTYLSVVEEYSHLGPIVDFDLLPTTPGGSMTANKVGREVVGGTSQSGSAANQSRSLQQQQQAPQQCQVVTASGCSKSGSLRVIRNGIGMNEYASVELSGIQNMWSLRPSFDAPHHAFLVQSYVGETRVLGVSGGESEQTPENAAESKDDTPEGEEEEEVGGTLEEAILPGLESNASTLYVGNVVGDLFLQITESQVRLVSNAGEVLNIWEPPNEDSQLSSITVACANETGQIAVALRGGVVMYLDVTNKEIKQVHQKQMDKEVSCLNLNPFIHKQASTGSSNKTSEAMDVDTDGVADSTEPRSLLLAVGLWDDFTVRMLSLELSLHELLVIHLDTEEDGEEESRQAAASDQQRRNRNNMMARSLCLISLDFSSSPSSSTTHSSNTSNNQTQSPSVDMLLVGLGDGTLVSFAVVQPNDGRPVQVQSRKEVSLGSQRINLIPLRTERGGTCVLATGDRPTVIYLAGIGGTASSSNNNYNPKLCYSNVNLSTDDQDSAGENGDISRPQGHQAIAVNVAAPFFSPLLFDHNLGNAHYSLCVADDSNLRLGVIDDIQKLHITTCRLGMAPRRVVYCPEGRLFAVGCIESGIKQPGMGEGDASMANCVRFIDDTTFEDIERINLDPFEMILSLAYTSLNVRDTSATGAADIGSEEPLRLKKYLIIGTAYALPDEDEPTKGRIILVSCSPDDGPDGSVSSSREVRTVAKLQVRGAVYSISQFYEGQFLASVNSKTHLCRIVSDGTGALKISFVGMGHHGHMLSLSLKSRADKSPMVLPPTTNNSTSSDKDKTSAGEIALPQTEQLAIVGDLMRSISLVEYYPEHETLEEIARDFNSNWTTAIEMLTDDVYLGCEHWNNLFVLRRNTKAQSEDVRCRLDTIGEFHLGELCNKFMSGSLVMPQAVPTATSSDGDASSGRRRSIASPNKSSNSGKLSASAAAGSRSRRPSVIVGSQTLFGTVDGTLGCILGLDGPTSAFFLCLERAMQQTIKPIGNFSHQQFRAFNAEKRKYPSHGFVDGDMIEAFMDLDRPMMERIVHKMNDDGGWEIDDPAFALANEKSGDSTQPDSGDEVRPKLAVDEVLALVEEIAMLH